VIFTGRLESAKYHTAQEFDQDLKVRIGLCFVTLSPISSRVASALRGNLRLAESELRQELIAYKQVIQLSFRDVSDALIGYQKLHQVRVAQEIMVKDLQDSVDTSLRRYQGGITTYLEVLDGQRSLFTAELTLEATSTKAWSNFTMP
jgi:outer membrane protein TolC